MSNVINVIPIYPMCPQQKSEVESVENLNNIEFSNLCVTQIGGRCEKSKCQELNSDLFNFGFTKTKSVHLVSGSDGASPHRVIPRKKRKYKWYDSVIQTQSGHDSVCIRQYLKPRRLLESQTEG